MDSKLRPELTIGMACRNDFDGVYFTVQALRLQYPDLHDWCELLVLDNDPDRSDAENIKRFCHQAAAVYYPYRRQQSTSVRDHIFTLARAPHVLVIDSHVLFHPGAVQCLRNYYLEHPQSLDLIHGPLYSDRLRDHIWTHRDSTWRNGMWGEWCTDPRGRDLDGPPFEIEQHGLGLFACSKAAWLGFNPLTTGFGGEEGYIQEKFRQAGRRVYCLPGLRWLHRFVRPGRMLYKIGRTDLLRNYALGFFELGLDFTELKRHWYTRKHPTFVNNVIAKAKDDWDRYLAERTARA